MDTVPPSAHTAPTPGAPTKKPVEGVDAPTVKTPLTVQLLSSVEVTTTSITPSGMKEGTCHSAVACAAGSDVLTVANSVEGEDWGYTFTDTAPVSSFVPTATQVMFRVDPCNTLVEPSGCGLARESVPTDVDQYPGCPYALDTTVTSAKDLSTIHHEVCGVFDCVFE
jgi:hypothetical protein